MDADQETDAPDMNKEILPQKCSFTNLKSNSKPLCPVMILCVHPSPPDQLLVHWKPTTALSTSGYEVNFPKHSQKHVTCITHAALANSPLSPNRLTLTECQQLKLIHKYAHLLCSMI